MNAQEKEEVLKILIGSFSNTISDDAIPEWDKYLSTQDYSVATWAANHIKLNSSSGFFPSISEFNQKARMRQAELSGIARSKANSGRCSECAGETWTFEDPTGVVPCSICNPSAYARWNDGGYELGVPSPEEEKAGPLDPYTLAAEPDVKTGVAVSAERAKQWADHIASGSTDAYPEGEIE